MNDEFHKKGREATVMGHKHHLHIEEITLFYTRILKHLLKLYKSGCVS